MKARGLTGDQGVIIPASNIKHLMLHEDVVQAAAAGKFHVFAVSTVDEAITLLTGVAAGERNAAGVYPEDSVNGRVEQRLIAMSNLLEKYGKELPDKEGKKSKSPESDPSEGS